jgi:hypothetical protein
MTQNSGLAMLARALADEYERAKALERKAQRYAEHLEVVAQVAHDNAPDPSQHKAQGTSFRSCHNPGCQRTVAVLRDTDDILRDVLYG